VTKRLINVDDELLATVQGALGTATKTDTVNTALREVARRHAATELAGLAATGVFDTARPESS
jgi:Arc/MetJ family transcription regulator